MKYRFLLMAALMIGSSLFISSCEDGFLSVSRGDGSVSSDATSTGVDPGPVNMYGYITALNLVDSTGVESTSTETEVPEPESFYTCFMDADTFSTSIWVGSASTPTYETDVITAKVEYGFDSVANNWNQATEVKWSDDVSYHGYLAVFPAVSSSDVDFASYPYTVAQGDLLWAKGNGIRPISVPLDLRFSHIVSRLEAIMEFGTEYTSTPNIVSVEIRCYDEATLNFYTQTITTSSTDADKVYWPLVLDQKQNTTTGDITAFDPSYQILGNNEVAVYSTTVIPQKVTAIRVLLDEEDAEYLSFAIPTLDVVSGSVYRVRLKVGHDNAILDGVYDGTDWDDDTVDAGLLQQGENYDSAN